MPDPLIEPVLQVSATAAVKGAVPRVCNTLAANGYPSKSEFYEMLDTAKHVCGLLSEEERLGEATDCISCFQGIKPPGAPKTRPRSARPVATIEWSWGPANSRRDEYFLSTDRARRRWYLWLFDGSEPGYEINEVVAHCPRGHVDALSAADRLLRAFWADDDLNRELGWPNVISTTSLSEQAIRSIARATTARFVEDGGENVQ